MKAKFSVILSEAKNLGSNSEVPTYRQTEMFHFAQHNSAYIS